MRFPESVYVGSFVLAAMITAASMPVWRRVCIRFGLVDDPGGRKIHSLPIPLAGGPAIVSAILVAAACCAVLVSISLLDPSTSERMRYGFIHRTGQLMAILSGGLAMFSLGLLDDRYEFSPGIKLFGQLLVGFLVAASGIRITLFVPSIVFSYAVTIFWIVTLVNAFNFMDNMNGLCAGLAAIASLIFGVSAAVRGEYLVAGMAFLCCGAFCGFLPYNFPRASSFLGDSGSHLAGYIIAVLAILPRYYSSKHPHALAVFTPLLVVALPLYDLASVVLIRWRLGRPFYVGDNNHLSHRLVRRGLTQIRAVELIWLAAVLLGGLSLLL
jgi:UDP-GlcNAc:undecaprenyl-phosphate GlcNAc-1-phosphate transferase